MKTFFHADQALHHPQTYFSRGKMRTPQEVPERAMHLLAAAKRLGFDIRVLRITARADQAVQLAALSAFS